MENSTEGEYGDDYYDADYDDVCNREALIRFGSTVIPIFFTIVVLLSLIGNILVLVVTGLYPWKSLADILFLNLAVSDLIFTLGLPFWACYHIWGWTFGDFMCKAVNFIFAVGFYSSTVLLMVINIQRYVTIVYLYYIRGVCSVVFVVLPWVVSIMAALPDLLYNEVIPGSDSKLYCEFNSTFAPFDITYEQNIIFVAAFSVMLFCYTGILRVLRKRRRHRLIKLIVCIVSVFFVCWAPYNIVIFLRSLTYRQIYTFSGCDVSVKLDYAFYVCRVLAYSHCCLNPVLYVFVSPTFRDYLRKRLQKSKDGENLQIIQLNEVHRNGSLVERTERADSRLPPSNVNEC